MYLSKKVNGFALAAGFGLVFAGLIACSDDTTSSPREKDPLPVKVETTTVVDSNGNVVTRIDTIPGYVDSSKTIDPVTGDTFYKYDTTYEVIDTTLRWVGNSALVITEISPINLDWLDENGDDPGWVEIYNAGNETANLKGYSLVENRDKPRKWVFGEEMIKPKEFRIVFCDKNDVNAVPSDDPASELHVRTHTNWKLGKTGGVVYLIDPYYGIRDSVVYPELASGMSWGIMDGGEWKFFEKPTPERRNTESTAYDGMAPKFTFSGSQGGFYNDAVTLNPPTGLPEGMTVRCTQDGSAPTESSPEFNSVLTIDHTMVLRCAAYKQGLLTKDVVTNTYFIGETVNMPVVAVSVDPSFFVKYYKKTNGGTPDMKHDQMYAPNESYPEDPELPVHVEYFANGSKSSEKAWEAEAGISLMGGWSRMERKKSVAIVMREEYGGTWLKYPLFETRKGVNDKYKGFNLRNNGNRFVADYFADAVGGAILEGSGVDYQRSRQVVVFYNGTYYGIHDMRERYNKNFVETNYGIDAGSVNFIKHLNKTVTASNGTTADYLAMLAFVNGNDMTVAANYEAVKNLMDVGNFADYMIAEMYIHNGDWPDNNVRAWKSPEQPWKFMIYDLDHGFQWEWNVDGFGASMNMFTWVKQGGKNGCNSGEFCFATLYNKLIKNDEFKRLFINHAAVMFGSYLNGNNVTEKAKFIAGMLDAADVERDMSVEAYQERRSQYAHSFDPYGEKLGPWALERDSKVLSEYKSEFGLGDMVSVTIASTGKGSVLMEGMKLPGSTATSTNYSGKFFSGVQMELVAVPAVGSVFNGWTGCEPVAGSQDRCIATIAGGQSITANFSN